MASARPQFKAVLLKQLDDEGQPKKVELSVRPRRALRAFKKLQRQYGKNEVQFLPPPATPGQLKQLKLSRARAEREAAANREYKARKEAMLKAKQAYDAGDLMETVKQGTEYIMSSIKHDLLRTQ